MIIKGEVKIMENKNYWEKTIEEALVQARSKNKPVLLDFFNPE